MDAMRAKSVVIIRLPCGNLEQNPSSAERRGHKAGTAFGPSCSYIDSYAPTTVSRFRPERHLRAPSKGGDGIGEFCGGKRVPQLRYSKEAETVLVVFIDVANGEEHSILAALVLEADGRQSTIHRLFTRTTSIISKVFQDYQLDNYAGCGE
ncbi:hypothetical protein F5Y16DRAFT_404073 [Xylariaceae sp. FL0255]|nr:hypothetical protein F5Y16DRAFT_404073 [Xylariaceae sp. FL0255]